VLQHNKNVMVGPQFETIQPVRPYYLEINMFLKFGVNSF